MAEEQDKQREEPGKGGESPLKGVFNVLAALAKEVEGGIADKVRDFSDLLEKSGVEVETIPESKGQQGGSFRLGVEFKLEWSGGSSETETATGEAHISDSTSPADEEEAVPPTSSEGGDAPKEPRNREPKTGF